MRPSKFLTLLFLACTAVLALAQEPPRDVRLPPREGFRPLDTDVQPTAPGLARQDGEEPGITLTMCTTNLRKTLVHDSSGRLLAEARSLTVEIPKFGEQPVATCKMYLGVYEPTGASTKSWKIREIRLVDDTEFQRLVDSGSTGFRVDQELPPGDPAAAPEAAPRAAPPKAATGNLDGQIDRTGTIPLGPATGGPPKN